MTMTNVFAVIGQATADPSRLLLLGEDGRFYAYAPDGQPRPAEPGDGWRLDSAEGSGEKDAVEGDLAVKARAGRAFPPPDRTNR